eukprot:1161368-Pelagomonas_calceolata.AAC.1
MYDVLLLGQINGDLKEEQIRTLIVQAGALEGFLGGGWLVWGSRPRLHVPPTKIFSSLLGWEKNVYEEKIARRRRSADRGGSSSLEAA